MYSMERLMEIWNDDTGELIEVGQDRDSLGLVEIRQFDNNHKIENRMTVERGCAVKIAEAILEYCNDKRNFEK